MKTIEMIGEIKMTYALKSIQDQMDNIKIADEASASIARTFKEISLMKKESQYRIILYKSFKSQVADEDWISLEVDKIIDRTARKIAELP